MDRRLLVDSAIVSAIRCMDQFRTGIGHLVSVVVVEGVVEGIDGVWRVRFSGTPLAVQLPALLLQLVVPRQYPICSCVLLDVILL